MTTYYQPDANDGIDEELAELEAAFAEAPEAEGRGEVPDGTYRCKVETVDLTRGKTSKLPLLKWKLQILDGPHRGGTIWKNSSITPEGLRYLKSDLRCAGLVLQQLADLRASLPRLLDQELEVAKVRSRDGQGSQVYFNERRAQGFSSSTVITGPENAGEMHPPAQRRPAPRAPAPQRATAGYRAS